MKKYNKKKLAKRGRPLGSRKKKRRGRPKGSKNKIITITPIIRVKLKCQRCKKHWKIRTSKTNLPLYTTKLKKNWICPICN